MSPLSKTRVCDEEAIVGIITKLNKLLTNYTKCSSRVFKIYDDIF